MRKSIQRISQLDLRGTRVICVQVQCNVLIQSLEPHGRGFASLCRSGRDAVTWIVYTWQFIVPRDSDTVGLRIYLLLMLEEAYRKRRARAEAGFSYGAGSLEDGSLTQSLWLDEERSRVLGFFCVLLLHGQRVTSIFPVWRWHSHFVGNSQL